MAWGRRTIVGGLVMAVLASGCVHARDERAARRDASQAEGIVLPPNAAAQAPPEQHAVAEEAGSGATTSTSATVRPKPAPLHRSTGTTATGRGDRQPTVAPRALDGEVRVGIVYPDSRGALGPVNPQNEDFRKIFTALVDWANERGGFGGRRIVPVFEPFVTSSANREAQELEGRRACRSLTEDHRVFMAIVVRGAEFNLDCYADARTPVLLRTTGNQFDGETYEALYPWVIATTDASLDTIARLVVDALGEEWFKGGRVGLVTLDAPHYRRVVERVLLPALRRFGVDIHPDDRVYAPISLDTGPAAITGGAVRLQANGVDRVVSVASNQGWALMAREAEDRGWRPRWGLTSIDGPPANASFYAIGDAQKANIRGAGYMPYADVGDAAYPVTPRERECWSRVNARVGSAYDTRFFGAGNGAAALIACELVEVAYHALAPAAGRPLAQAAVAAHVEAIGEGYVPLSVPSSRFARGKTDGNGGYFRLGWEHACRCFRYQSAWVRAG